MQRFLAVLVTLLGVAAAFMPVAGRVGRKGVLAMSAEVSEAPKEMSKSCPWALKPTNLAGMIVRYCSWVGVGSGGL